MEADDQCCSRCQVLFAKSIRSNCSRTRIGLDPSKSRGKDSCLSCGFDDNLMYANALHHALSLLDTQTVSVNSAIGGSPTT